MKKIFNKVAIFSLLILGVGCSDSQNEQVVFMDTFKVFEGFEMKKDCDSRLEKDIKSESALLDSIGVLLNQATVKKDEQAILRLKKDYFIAEKIFNEKFQELSQKYTTEVNERLNEYLKAYGKSKGYTFILGSSGQGNIMYVDEKNDVTNEILAYVNKEYSR